MAYRLAIFDLDGTLADTWPWFVDALDAAALRFGFRRPDSVERQELRSCGSREILNRLQVPIWKVPAIARHMRAEKAKAQIGLFPGVDAMLASLSEAGIELAMVSSDSEANVRRTLGAANAARIDHYACEASLFGKAAHLRRVLKRGGVPAGQAIYVGDEVRDAEAARKVGMAFGAVTWGFAAPAPLRAHAPEAVFDTMEALTSLVTELDLVVGSCKVMDMAVMLGNLYGALREAGVPDDKAQKAAEEAAATSDVADLKKDVGQLKTDTAVLKWMLGFNLALTVAVLDLILRGTS